MNRAREKWFDRLREMAEQVVKDQSMDIKTIDPTDLTKLINDIQVFQVELEIQNDELRTSLDELEKSRTRFSRLFDMAPAGYIILDESGIVLDVNQTMMDMLQRRRDDLMRKPFSRFIVSGDQGIFLARFPAFFKHPADKTMEIRLTAGRRSLFHARLEGRFIPLETCPGNPDEEQFCLIVTDITAAKKAEKELQNHAAMLKERNKELNCLYSISGLLNDPANSMEDCFTKTIRLLANAMQYPDDACGRIICRTREYATPDFKETPWKLTRDILVNGETMGCVEVYYTKKMPVIHGSPFLEEERALIDSIAMRLEQTLAKNHAQSLEKQTRRYLQAVLQTTADGFWVLDTQGRMIDVNDAYCKMTGYSKDQILGMTIGDLDTIESPEMTAQRIQQIVTHGSEFFETWHRRRDGSVFPVEISATWLPIERGRLVCFGRDIGERKQAEARILHLERAKSLGRMAKAVAHHYNNLLTIIMGNMEMAMLDIPGDGEPAKNLTHAMEAARRASKLGTMMLTSLGQMSEPMEPLDLSLACKELLPAIRAQMPLHISLEADLPEPGPTVTANALQIRHILECLITNAWEAMDTRSGVVCLCIRRVSPTQIPTRHRYPVDFAPQQTDYACMEVTDTGTGIPEKDIDKIFEPFYSTRFIGRGLGLSVALGAVKAQSGSMAVSSIPGEGSRFSVFLPLTGKDSISR